MLPFFFFGFKFCTRQLKHIYIYIVSFSQDILPKCIKSWQLIASLNIFIFRILLDRYQRKLFTLARMYFDKLSCNVINLTGIQKDTSSVCTCVSVWFMWNVIFLCDFLSILRSQLSTLKMSIKNEKIYSEMFGFNQNFNYIKSSLLWVTTLNGLFKPLLKIPIETVKIFMINIEAQMFEIY